MIYVEIVWEGAHLLPCDDSCRDRLGRSQHSWHAHQAWTGSSGWTDHMRWSWRCVSRARVPCPHWSPQQWRTGRHWEAAWGCDDGGSECLKDNVEKCWKCDDGGSGHQEDSRKIENVIKADQGPVSRRLMTSQFKDIVTHMQKYKTVKCIFCGAWVQKFVWNFKGALWNFTQNFEPIHRKICILWGVKTLTTYDILSYDILSLSGTGTRVPERQQRKHCWTNQFWDKLALWNYHDYVIVSSFLSSHMTHSHSPCGINSLHMVHNYSPCGIPEFLSRGSMTWMESSSK